MFEQDESMLRFGVTPVENLFIQEYLPAARGDYVKVYLYALYISAHPKKELSAAEIAQELGMPQSDVEGALRYWERRHLLVRLTDNPPAYQLKSPAQLLLSGEAGMEADSAFVAFSEDIYALFGDRRKVRPTMVHGARTWGYTYKLAGFREVGETKGGLLTLQLLPADMPPPCAAREGASPCKRS